MKKTRKRDFFEGSLLKKKFENDEFFYSFSNLLWTFKERRLIFEFHNPRHHRVL